MPTNALILSGGGARAAYQVGVLQALSDILPDLRNPFPIICGTSAGAINAASIAANTGHFREAVLELAELWQKIEFEQVFRTGWAPLLSGLYQVGKSLFNQGVSTGGPLALLDNSPLRHLILRSIPFENLDKRIAAGELEALCVTALGYTSGESVSFFQGADSLRGWRRFRRVGSPTQLSADHLMASSAIPTIFPTVAIDREYYGDGAMRQMAPISPALHLGADRALIIGVSSNRNPAHWGRRAAPARHSPSMAQIVGQMFNSAFIDSLEGDIEHMERINHLLSLVDKTRLDAGELHLRQVETLIISPSRPLDKIAGRKVRRLPRSLRFLMRSTGATIRGGGSAAASYLMFSHDYCSELMELGYQDAMWEREAIQNFFKPAS